MKQKKEKTRYQAVNGVILVLHIIFPVWLMALMLTYSISTIVFSIVVSSSLLLGVIYKLVKKFHKGKCILYIARCIAITAYICFYLPMLVLLNFSNSKFLYPLKRSVYIYGVYGGSSSNYYEQLIPSDLPDICEDYSFRTQGSVPAQDYHPSSYLMFHTDKAALETYALHFDQLDCQRLENDPENEPVQKKIEWVLRMMGLRESFQDNLDHAVIYWFNDYYPKAVLLNFETGLVAILT